MDKAVDLTVKTMLQLCNTFVSKLGKGKQYGHPSLMVSPDTLILSHSGVVKVSTHVARGKKMSNGQFVL